MDTLTQITWLAAHTSRVHLFPNVADLPLRPPAMLAKQWIDLLATLYTDVGMNTLVFWPDGDRERQSRIFAEEIVPAVREAPSS